MTALFLTLLAPAAWASCSGLSGEELSTCEAAEAELRVIAATRSGELPAAAWRVLGLARTPLTQAELAAFFAEPAELCRRFPQRGPAALRSLEGETLFRLGCDGKGGVIPRGS